MIFCLSLYGTMGTAQIVQSGLGTWNYLNLPDPVTPTPWNFTEYTAGIPAGWNTTGYVLTAAWQTNYTNLGGTPPTMWVDESGGQVHGALFRTNFNLTGVAGSFRLRVRPNNECRIFVNGTQVGGTYNWSNNLVTVCVPSNLMVVGNNVVAIQTTEWLDNNTSLRFDLWNDAITGPTVSPATATYCSDDAPVNYLSGANGTWSGNGMTANGVFTPSPGNVGTNILTYTDNSGVCPSTQTVQAIVENCCADSCFWRLVGNPNIQASNFIGSTNNADFKMRSNNIERMTIEANGNIGINNTTPANKLELTHGINGNSGLRLTNLPNTVPASTNPTNKVLSVNGSGDVILVNGGSSSSVNANQGLTISGNTVMLGDNCSENGGAFMNNREINMNNHNLYFNSGRDDESLGKIYMGGEKCKDLNTRLEISARGLLNPKNSYASPDPSLSGLRFTNLTANNDPIQNKTKGVLSLDRDGDVIWVQTCCSSGGFKSTKSTLNMIPRYIGDETYESGQIFDNNQSIGIGTVSGFGFTGMNRMSNTSGTFKLDVNGAVRGLSYITIADENLKTDIKNISNADELISKIEGKKYAWNQNTLNSSNTNSGQEYGFVAQDLGEVVPEAVVVDENGIHGIDYNAIIPILVESQKSLMAKIDKQDQQISDLMKIIEGLQANSTQVNQTTLSDGTEIILEQNVPNPFKDMTSIGYFLPENTKNAQIVFTTLDGKTIKTVNLIETGRGSLNVYNDELSNGVYMYTLVVDGRVVDSKKMNLNY